MAKRVKRDQYRVREDNMKYAKRVLKIAVGGALALALAAPAFTAAAEDSIYVPLFTYRTGPFGGSGTPIADGQYVPSAPSKASSPTPSSKHAPINSPTT